MHITTMKQCLLFWLPDLSSYIPKHSVDFSTWQEHKHNSSVSEEDSSGQQTQMTEEVMVSPPLCSPLLEVWFMLTQHVGQMQFDVLGYFYMN